MMHLQQQQKRIDEGNAAHTPTAVAGRRRRHSGERDDSGNPIRGIESMEAAGACQLRSYRAP
jgi:hypothetical protein